MSADFRKAKINENKFLRWYAGSHCYPKCSLEKVEQCILRMEELLPEVSKIATHRDFVIWLRLNTEICDLTYEQYKVNPYREMRHNCPACRALFGIK